MADQLLSDEQLDRLRKAVQAEVDGEPVASRIDYVVLKPNCGYCGEPAEVIRVTQRVTGEIAVMTLCRDDANGESKHCCEEGMVPVVPGSTFLNPEVFGEIPDEARAIPLHLLDPDAEVN